MKSLLPTITVLIALGTCSELMAQTCHRLFDSPTTTVNSSDQLNILNFSQTASSIDVKKISSRTPGVTLTERGQAFEIDYAQVSGEKVALEIPFVFEKDFGDSWRLDDAPILPRQEQITGPRPSRFNYRAVALPAMAAAQYRTTIINSYSLFEHAALNVLVRGGVRPAGGHFTIESDLTRQLSRQTGKHVYYEAPVIIPDQSMDWINVRLSEFKLINSPVQMPLATTPQKAESIGIILPTDLRRKNGAKKIEISSHVMIEVDLNGQVDSFIDAIQLVSSGGGGPAFFHKNRYSEYLGGSRDIEKHAVPTKNLLKKFFKNMANVKAQNEIRQLLQGGKEAAARAFAPYGWRVSTKFDKRISFLSIIEAISEKDLFYEGGAFGKVHGELSHHAQILTGIYGMTKPEAQECLDFISDYIGRPSQSNVWPLWSALFDSRGDGITSSRYWRKVVYGR